MKKIVPGISMAGAAACMLLFLAATSLSQAGSSPLGPPEIGTTTLQLLSPTVVELSRVTSKAPPPARVTEWDYVTAAQELRLPPASAFQVSVDGQPVSILDIGFRRRPLYAPLKKRDLRIGNNLYLKLSSPVPDHALVRVDIDAAVWPTNAPNTVLADPWRESQVIHLSQVGYLPGCSKKAIVGYYLGSLQELDIPSSGFQVVERDSGQVVFSGALSLRQDVGYNYVPPPYQNVWEADFTPLREQGQYRVVVPGLGASRPFRIDDGVAACMARTYALGLYHQRCGTVNELPFTRHIHGVCHTAKADVPTMAFSAVNNALADFSSDYRNNPRHTAPQLKAINASLYPFVNSGKVDVSGGHHDAGDYSKYTINSAQLIHALIFAIDALPGVAALDNLGLPESGDGLGDLMQEAKWEAEFLAKMQDADGGFYFLVYPRTRAYEDNVLPDRGDPQAVFPKNTAATAAAIAALAQTASSPTFRRAYPELAAQYLAQALQGWAFLQRAFAQFGRDGSYQKISHYGDEFMHDDEIAWAAAELFGATGDHTFEAELTAAFNPNDRNTRRFTWWRLFEGYGCAIRSYAFAGRTGRLPSSALSPDFLHLCEDEIRAAADDQVRFCHENAYGSSFPDPNKAFRSAGWFFSLEQTFDMTTAAQLDPQPALQDATVSNMAFEAGVNPLNLSLVTGLGWHRQIEIVHQYAQNDRRVLPPSGIPIGNLQSGLPDLKPYPAELGGLCFPADRAATAPYAPYDIWADTYNTTTEPVAAQQARSLASLAGLMAQTPLAHQPWRSASAAIVTRFPAIPIGLTNSATLAAPGLDLASAEIIWEGRNQLPKLGPTFEVSPTFLGPYWIEAEALCPDGRRVFAGTSFDSLAPHPITALTPSVLRIVGAPGQEFVLEGSTDLNTWTPLTTNSFSADTYDFNDPAGSTLSWRFYRAVAR